ncbi:uncharacterized protein PHACADRAFT_201841 [Phanerochaete carnosa HHB-10118-sp]|uniref:Uncharacterized protein n=1 Tax=Phanerochaete carnosa (strain HHB-10118-sp) TaxID=650164 RepID=K5WGD2_PHACS|nr:uncharacterized protein PHACADRAFT_201841 [Phanerochaete carnosa HHB-10118-sp]EKM49257.1 hypothetical protein PHACADRAFT_201841 [Phanerochaete carnosa HHB-10118-sp]
MYAAGFYDYDEALGLVVFSNTCSKLAIFNLSALCNASLEGCFEAFPIPYDDRRHEVEVVPETMIPATFAPPFPYLGPLIPPQEYADALCAQWKARQPDPVPQQWEEPDIPGNDKEVLSWFRWKNLIPKIPDGMMDIG